MKLELKKRLLLDMEYDIICCSNMDIEEGEYIQRLEAFEMWIWRRVMKISWTEHRSNQELCDMVGENRGLINSIRQGQKNWMGHVLRGDSISPSYSLGG